MKKKMKTILDIKEEYKKICKIDNAFTNFVDYGIVNKGQNRYSDVMPYDFWRYKLETFNGRYSTDYINASIIIPGMENNGNEINECKYIATQGPTHKSVENFWRLILDELLVQDRKTVNVVMLTELEENGREKCFDYIKDMEVKFNENFMKYLKYYGNEKFKVSKMETREEFNGGIEIREIKIFDELKNESKKIRHFWIRNWPDFGVPDLSNDNNLNCIKLLNGEKFNNTLIVHCSAGVGRSGTFIGLHWIYNNIANSGGSSNKFNINYDILNVVINMRKCRMMMVQRLEQYVYMYQFVIQLLEG